MAALALVLLALCVWWIVSRPIVAPVPAPPPGDAATQPDLNAVPVEPVDVEAAHISVATVDPAPLPRHVEEPSIQGQVVDAQDRPVPDAALAVYEPEHGLRKGFTDTAGRFAVGSLPPGTYRVSVQKAHFNDAVLDAVPAGEHNLVVVLTGTSSATGRVLDAAGQPIVAFEMLYLKAPPADEAHWLEIVRNERTPWQSVTASEGGFQLEDIASGAPFALGARAVGYEPAYVTVAAAHPEMPAAPAEIRLQVEAGVVGVILSPDRLPVSGATIHLGDDSEALRVAECGADGRFELLGLGDTPLTLTAVHKDYLPATKRIIPGRGETVAAEFILGAGSEVEGVVWKGNAPAAGQTVAVSRLTPPRISKETVTDGQGRYRIAGIGPGAVTVLAKWTPEGAESSPLRLQREAEVKPGQVTVVDFRFPVEFAALDGAITINGKPAPLAEVTGGTFTSEGQSIFRGTAGEDGLFAIQDILPGAGWAEVTAHAGDTELKRSFELDFIAGTVTALDVPFETSVGVSGTISGMNPGEIGQVMALRGHEEVDVSSNQAILQLDGLSTGESDIGEDGSFAIDGLEPGPYTLLVLVFVGMAQSSDESFDSLRTTTHRVTVPDIGRVRALIRLP